MHMQYSSSLLQHVCDKQSTNSHLESQVSMLKSLGMLGPKILGCFVLTDAIDVPESCHAQPCDHGQSNYP